MKAGVQNASSPGGVSVKPVGSQKEQSAEKKPFVEPKLEFVEPKLQKQGDFTKLTGSGFFGPFSP